MNSKLVARMSEISKILFDSDQDEETSIKMFCIQTNFMKCAISDCTLQKVSQSQIKRTISFTLQ